MNMVMMAVPGANLCHPGMGLVLFDAAKFLLDCSVHKHAFDFGLLGSGFDEGDVLRRPGLRTDTLPVVCNEVGGGNGIALLLAQYAIRHRHEPNIHVETNLVAGVV